MADAPKRSPLTIAILAGRAKEDGKGDKKDDKPEGEPDGDEGEEDEGDESMGLESAYEELAAAMKKGDTKAGVEALRSFVEQCR
ncbi:MAG TPA: hypothetical protein VFJ24_11905 [Gaiellales bacterium]|nr:hypothetical protein [Gaiellales bacterium]